MVEYNRQLKILVGGSDRSVVSQSELTLQITNEAVTHWAIAMSRTRSS